MKLVYCEQIPPTLTIEGVYLGSGSDVEIGQEVALHHRGKGFLAYGRIVKLVPHERFPWNKLGVIEVISDDKEGAK